MLEYGRKYPNLDSLMENINSLGTERATLTREIERIMEDTEEARLFLSDPEAIVAMLTDVRTYMESGEEKAVKDLLKSFISRIESSTTT